MEGELEYKVWPKRPFEITRGNLSIKDGEKMHGIFSPPNMRQSIFAFNFNTKNNFSAFALKTARPTSTSLRHKSYVIA